MTPAELLKQLDSDQVSARTREVLLERINERPVSEPSFFSSAEFECARALASCVIVHRSEWAMPDLAGALDQRLTRGDGKGWRYDALKPEREMWREGLAYLDAEAIRQSGSPFASLRESERESLLHALFDSADDWRSLFWEEVLAEFVENYYAHPFAQAEINALGMIDGGLPRVDRSHA